MKEYRLNVIVKQYDSPDELDPKYKNLLQNAVEACKLSYAPFSGFNVGAAILLADGKIIKGGNQENVAFPSGLCAERVAGFYAGSEYPDVPVVAVAVTSSIKGVLNKFPVRPCGSCRQSLLQSELRFKNKITVIMAGSDRIETVEGISSLLPLCFDLDDYK